MSAPSDFVVLLEDANCPARRRQECRATEPADAGADDNAVNLVFGGGGGF